MFLLTIHLIDKLSNINDRLIVIFIGAIVDPLLSFISVNSKNIHIYL